MRIEGNRGHSGATAEQILGEIRDYCRETRTAESPFGRLVVNDGKLVSFGGLRKAGAWLRNYDRDPLRQTERAVVSTT